MRIRLAEVADAEAIRTIYNVEVLGSTNTFDMVPRTRAEQEAWILEHSGVHPALVAAEPTRLGRCYSDRSFPRSGGRTTCPTATEGTPPRAVAQLVEHRSPKPAVGGSSPSCPAPDVIIQFETLTL